MKGSEQNMKDVTKKDCWKLEGSRSQTSGASARLPKTIFGHMLFESVYITCVLIQT